MGPASFWLLGFLLTHPEALSAVRTEMEALKASSVDGVAVTPVFGETSSSRCWFRPQSIRLVTDVGNKNQLKLLDFIKIGFNLTQNHY